MTQQITLTAPASAVNVTLDADQVTLVQPATALTIQVHHLPGTGAGSSGFDFTQASAATTWTINHNLGYKPAVDLATSGGVELDGQVTHTSANQVVVQFNTAQAGTARLA